MTDTATRPEVAPSLDGDHERFSHIVQADPPPAAKSASAKVTEAMVLGEPITALCGKTWVPSRDPSRYPLCPECKRVYEELRAQGPSS